MAGHTILVGIGGTGAKVVQGVIHVAAAGLINGDIDVFFVDQDGANGNTTRAATVADTYSRLVDAMADWRSREPDGTPARSGALRTKISVRERVFQPISAKKATLETIFGVATEPALEDPDHDDAWLMRALFNEVERCDPMDNGFRARPAVGSAAYRRAQALCEDGEQDQSLWFALKALIEQRAVDHPEGVHVVLIGSIFGGTGASGLPYLGQELRRLVSGSNGALDQVRICGLIMLPYFFAPRPDGHVGRCYGPAETGQVRLALNHYANLMERASDKPFVDSIYLVGMARRSRVAYDKEGGGGEQVNPAMLAELVAALGVAHFCNDEKPKNSTHYALYGDGDHITLADLPMPNAGQAGQSDRLALLSLLRSAYAYLHSIYPLVTAVERGEEGLGDYPFLAHHLPKRLNEEHKILLKNFADYFGDLLKWYAALEFHAPPTLKVELVRAEGFAEPLFVPGVGAKLRFVSDNMDIRPAKPLTSSEIAQAKAAFEGFYGLAPVDALDRVMARLCKGRRWGTSATRSVGAFVAELLSVSAVRKF